MTTTIIDSLPLTNAHYVVLRRGQFGPVKTADLHFPLTSPTGYFGHGPNNNYRDEAGRIRNLLETDTHVAVLASTTAVVAAFNKANLDSEVTGISAFEFDPTTGFESYDLHIITAVESGDSIALIEDVINLTVKTQEIIWEDFSHTAAIGRRTPEGDVILLPLAAVLALRNGVRKALVS